MATGLDHIIAELIERVADHVVERLADAPSPATAADPTACLTTEEVADRLGTTETTVRLWRGRRPYFGPPYLRLGPRMIRYRVADLEAWLRERAEEEETSLPASARPRGL